MKIAFVSKRNYWSEYLWKKLLNHIISEKEIIWFRICYTDELLKKFDKESFDYLFFFHWSDIVAEEIYKNNNCIVLHTSNLPDGRGGSPIQNQFLNKVYDSKVNAILMQKEIDSGPIFCSKPVKLQGNLFDIWTAIANSAYEVILEFLTKLPSPKEQNFSKDDKIYKRLKTNNIDFESKEDLLEIYDFIKIHDAEGYPKANIKINDFKIEFSRAKFDDNKLICDVLITKDEN